MIERSWENVGGQLPADGRRRGKSEIGRRKPNAHLPMKVRT